MDRFLSLQAYEMVGARPTTTVQRKIVQDGFPGIAATTASRKTSSDPSNRERRSWAWRFQEEQQAQPCQADVNNSSWSFPRA
jgi:hypothetical protein